MRNDSNNKLLIKETTLKLNLPTVLITCQLLIQNFTKGNEVLEMKHFKSYQLKANTETTLPSTLMIYEVWVISNFRNVEHEKRQVVE